MKKVLNFSDFTHLDVLPSLADDAQAPPIASCWSRGGAAAAAAGRAFSSCNKLPDTFACKIQNTKYKNTFV